MIKNTLKGLKNIETRKDISDRQAIAMLSKEIEGIKRALAINLGLKQCCQCGGYFDKSRHVCVLDEKAICANNECLGKYIGEIVETKDEKRLAEIIVQQATLINGPRVGMFRETHQLFNVWKAFSGELEYINELFLEAVTKFPLNQ